MVEWLLNEAAGIREGIPAEQLLCGGEMRHFSVSIAGGGHGSSSGEIAEGVGVFHASEKAASPAYHSS